MVKCLPSINLLEIVFSQDGCNKIFDPHAFLKCDIDIPPMKRWKEGLHSLSLNLDRPKTMAKGTLCDFQGKVIQLLPSLLLNVCSWMPPGYEKVMSHGEGTCRFQPIAPTEVPDDSQAPITRHIEGKAFVMTPVLATI